MTEEITTTSGGEAAIRIRNLEVELGGTRVLTGVNAAIMKGEITALIGPNGAGKTTLLLAMLGLIHYKGKIDYLTSNGRPMIGYVPQYLDFDRGIPITVMDFLCMWRQRLPVWISHSRVQRRRALEALEWVEAAHVSGRVLGALSGGELQRVLLAMALLDEPEIIFLDEPASAVDRHGEEIFMRLIGRINRERGITILIVSHDISMVTRIARQVICLNRQVLSEGKTAEILNENTLAACFGPDKGLLLHDHHWDGEVHCAQSPDSSPEGRETD